MRRIARDPVVHFMVLGALLFFARDLLPHASEPIHVGVADIEQLRADWRRDTGRDPTSTQLRASVARWLEDEALLREALRLGLDRSDDVARRRLLMNLRSVQSGSTLDEVALLREAAALQMPRSDLVARRRLIQAMEQRLVEETEWSAAELDAYIAAHPERYAAQVRFAFRHVYLASSRGSAEAAQMLEVLRANSSNETLPGDPFLLGARFDSLTAAQIEQRFGAPLAEALAAARAREWIGPVSSPYGLHLVQLERRDVAGAGNIAVQRRAAAYAFIAEREAQWLARARADLRQRYRIRIEPGLPLELSS
jgi:hypothetical protein